MKTIKKHQYIIDTKGKKNAVILPLDEYEKLLEDLHDLRIIAERKNEKNIDFDKIKSRLK
ncbi:MAG: type II toxin-antitoxin system Phd/YefM family antitoxin [Spirochaetes bacterium]|nr:type II toxin-antitoxin system Phd/YefM family antitoxin [Spirochaetota bacterium]